MPAHSRSENGIAELVVGPATSGRTRWLAYGAGIHVLKIAAKQKTWMAGTSPAMTTLLVQSQPIQLWARNRFRLNRLRFRTRDGLATKLHSAAS